ncbi:MAG: hypothetical protein ACRC9I_08645, partial [Acinetobacter sp.]
KGRAEALKKEALVIMGNQLRDVLNGGTAETRLDAILGTNTSKDWMDKYLEYWEGRSKKKEEGGDSGAYLGKLPKSKGANSISTPNIQAPNININTPNVPSSSAKTVTYKIDFGGKSLELVGDPSQQNLMNDFLSELEQLNRAR